MTLAWLSVIFLNTFTRQRRYIQNILNGVCLINLKILQKYHKIYSTRIVRSLNSTQERKALKHDMPDSRSNSNCTNVNENKTAKPIAVRRSQIGTPLSNFFFSFLHAERGSEKIIFFEHVLC